MDKDLKKLISETITKTFATAPEKLIERGVREIQYDICPHCKTEIHEKHEYTEDGGVTWRHSDCKGLIARPETPLEEIDDWFRPYVKESRIQRQEAREKLGYAPLPSEEPGGTMAAVNTTNLSTEAVSGVAESEETKPVGPRDYAKFASNMMNFVNASNVPLKVSVTEFTAAAGGVHSVKSYIVKVDNG